MPVEVKELVIRAIVNGTSEPRTPQDASGGIQDNRGMGYNPTNTQMQTVDRYQLIQACVKQVMKILHQKNDR